MKKTLIFLLSGIIVTFLATGCSDSCSRKNSETKKEEKPPVTYIGTKKPEYVKSVYDIVFSDGSSIPYSTDMTLTDEQKAQVVAIIFYSGTKSDLFGKKALGVGLVHKKEGTIWCSNESAASNINITTIQCREVEKNLSYTFEGDVDGSDNLSQIKYFLLNALKPTDTEIAEHFPAFYYAINYKDSCPNIVKGTDMEKGWYLPSIAELFEIYKNRVYLDMIAKICGGDTFGTDNYWSSTQEVSGAALGRILCFKGNLYTGYKSNDSSCVCAIKEF